MIFSDDVGAGGMIKCLVFVVFVVVFGPGDRLLLPPPRRAAAADVAIRLPRYDCDDEFGELVAGEFLDEGSPPAAS